MLINRKSFIQFFVFTTIGIVILYYLWDLQGKAYAEYCMINNIPSEDCSLTQKLINDYKGANYWWLAAACVLFMISNIFRALQWKQLVDSMGHNVRLSTTFYTVMIGYFANLIPPRVGEFVKAGLFSKYEKVPYLKVFGTIALTRIVDIIFMLFLMALGFLLFTDDMVSYVSANSAVSSLQIVMLMGLGLIGLVIAWKVYGYLNKIDSKNALFLKLKAAIDGFLEGISSLKQVKNKALFFSYSFGIWALYLLMHYVTFFAYEPTSHLTFVQSILAFDFGALGMVIPSPGGMGSYHALMAEALKILGIDSISAFSFAMIAFFTINVFCNIAFGILGLILLPLLNGPKK